MILAIGIIFIFLDPARDKNLDNHRMSKEAKVFRNGQMFNPEAIIPAVFPYEGV